MTSLPISEAPARQRPAPPMSPPGELAGWPWAATTRPFTALQHSFRVRVYDAELASYLEQVYRTLPAGAAEVSEYSVIDRGEGEGRYAVYCNDERVELTASRERAMAILMWHVNQEAVRSTVDSHVVLHAAAAERDGITVLLPAAMEAGKTTTVAGLLRAGFGYVTDEAVALDPLTLAAMPFHKPLSIDAGSWSVLPDLMPTAYQELVLGQWQVPADSITTLVGGVVPRLVVAPEYVPEAVTALEPITRGAMLAHLATCTFQFAAAPERNLQVLARLVQGAGCYRLRIGDLDSAVRLITDLVKEET
ncbi:MAG: hypothetical protein ABR549_07750 [Mycobacteriales bacterium]